MPTIEGLKEVTYQQQSMINKLSQAKDPDSKRALEIIKPQYEQNLNLYTKALNKYKQKRIKPGEEM